MFQELLEDPSQFEAGVAELLQEIIFGTKSFSDLSRTDKDLLNRATYDLATMKRPKPPEVKPVNRMPTAARMVDDEVEWHEGKHASVLAQALPGAPPTFWWEKT